MPNPIDWDYLAIDHDCSNPVDMISDWYYNKDMSVANMALKLGISQRSVYTFMKKEDIKIRTDNDRQTKKWKKSMRFYVRSGK